LWGTLWRYWPVLVIIIGLNILLRRFNTWAVSALIFAILLGCLGGAIWQHGLSSTKTDSGSQSVKSYSQALDGMDKLDVLIDFNAGNLNIRSLPVDSSDAVQVVSYLRSGNAGVIADFAQTGSEGTINFTSTGIKRNFWDADLRWDMKLNGTITLGLNIVSSAGNLDLDLSQMKVHDILMKMNAGNCSLYLPVPDGVTLVNITQSAANTDIVIPSGIPARIAIDSNISVLDIDQSRFTKFDNYYQSGDYDTATNRIKIAVKSDAGRISIK
jgi:hypothetical protein